MIEQKKASEIRVRIIPTPDVEGCAGEWLRRVLAEARAYRAAKRKLVAL